MMIVVTPVGVVYNALNVLDMTVYDCIACLAACFAGPKVSGTALLSRLMTILSSYRTMMPYMLINVCQKFIV